MKKYIITKEVEAEPMTMGEFYQRHICRRLGNYFPLMCGCVDIGMVGSPPFVWILHTITYYA